MAQVGEPHVRTRELARLILQRSDELVSEWERICHARRSANARPPGALQCPPVTVLHRLARTLLGGPPEDAEEGPAATSVCDGGGSSPRLADAVLELHALREALLVVWERRSGAVVPADELRLACQTLDDWIHGMVAAAAERWGPEAPSNAGMPSAGDAADPERSALAAFPTLKLSVSGPDTWHFLDALIHASSVGVLLVDRGLRCVRMNPAFAGMSGLSVHASVGRSLRELLPANAFHAEPMCQQVFQTGEAIQDVPFTHATPVLPGLGVGSGRASYYPLKDGADVPVMVAVAVVDFTERSEMERTQAILVDAGVVLSQSLELDTTIRSLATMAVTHLAEDCIVEILDAEGRFGRSQVMSRDPARLPLLQQFTPPAPGSKAEAVLKRALEEGEPRLLSTVTPEAIAQMFGIDAAGTQGVLALQPRSFLYFPLRARGRKLGMMTLAATVPGQLGRPSVLRLARALADRAGVAIHNAKLFEELQDALKMRDNVVAVVSHDLRNPLNAISLSAEQLLRQPGLSDAQQRTVKRMLGASQRGKRLIHDLLDMTQARRGVFVVHPKRMDLAPLLFHAVEEARTVHPDRRVELEVNCECQGVWDPDRLSQLVTNLLGNALQHGAREQPVRLRVQDEDGVLRLDVWNGGPPIPGDLLPVLFEPFRQGEGSRPKREGSVGLGLYISKQIVAAHGGELAVRSTERDGTTFTVRLPRLLPRDGAPDAADG